MIFIHIVPLKIIFSMKRVYVYVWGMGKMCVIFVCVLFESVENLKVYKRKNAPDYPISH